MVELHLVFGMLDELFLLFLLNPHPLFHDIGELSFQELVGVHFLNLFKFVFVERLEAVFVVLNEIMDLSEGSSLELLVLLNVDEPDGSFENLDVPFVVSEGVVYHISGLKLEGAKSGIFKFLVAASMHTY